MKPPQNNAEEMHRRKWLKAAGIDPGIIDPEKIYVCAGTSDTFPALAEELCDGWYDYMATQVDHYELGQIVTYNQNFWLGAFLWRRARSQSYPRDRWLGWHASQQAERLPLVAECLLFQPRYHAPALQPDYGSAALKAAVGTLQQHWLEFFGYRPLLADTHLAASSGFPWYFEQNGWERTTSKNPRMAGSHWIYELVPDAKKIITAKHLDRAYAGGTETNPDGLLPIPDELLASFRDAFKNVFDPRESNRHFPLESVLATALMALISGSDSVNSVWKFSTRLSGRQAELLGFPYNEPSRQYDLPNYHTYYRLLNRVNYMLVAESLVPWLKKHMPALPAVLRSDGEVIRDTLFSLAQRFRIRPKPIVKDYELPIGVDPDAPDGLKRDAQGNLID